MTQNNRIDGKLLCKMLKSGFANLSHNKDYLNEINVFPVSDGDTGANMKNTYGNGVVVLDESLSLGDAFSAFVKGMLLGSRGNSGFILSQYFLSIYECLKGKETASVADLSAALLRAYDTTYQTVLNPVEGTMLTIMREGIKRTQPQIGEQTPLTEFFDILVGEMFVCVQETVHQMDMLHDNNVVDSGAVGLYLVFDGMKRGLRGETPYFDCKQSEQLPGRNKALVKSVSFFRFCTEFTLRLAEPKDKAYFTRLLEKRGDSIVTALDDGCLKVHIHTNEPQGILDEFSRCGDIFTRKIDDLFQTEEFERLKLRKHEGFAVVAFTRGEGCAGALEGLGADVAFTIPFGHDPNEKSLKLLLEEFLKENLIVFPDGKETYEALKKIRWLADLQNLYIAETDNLPKAFFMLSSLLFADGFKSVVRALEKLKNRRYFWVKLRAEIAGNHMRYIAYKHNADNAAVRPDFAELLNATADENALKPYGAAVVFGGKFCAPKDAEAIRAHFEKFGDIDFTYIDGRQYDCDFIVGAF
jgi:dihydroxyacetone kinase-like predicted kinase